jgi:hypothetical protein
MKNGPVLSQLYDLIKGKLKNREQQNIWDCRFIKDGYNLIAVSDRIPVGELSCFEKDILDKIDAQLHDNDFIQMIDYVHKECHEWHDPRNSSVPIPFENVLKSVGYSEKIAWALEENSIFEEEKKLFACLVDY